MFSFNKNKKKVSYVVKAVKKPHLNPSKLRKGIIITLIVIMNIGFLTGFTAFFVRYSSNISELSSNLNPIGGLVNRIELPTITKSGLGLVSSGDDIFPQIVLNPVNFSAEYEIDPEGLNPFPKILNNNWKFVGRGDFDQNGFEDILLQNLVTNQLNLWLVEDGVVKGFLDLPSIADTKWQLKVVRDMNNDSYPDLVWTFSGQDNSNVLLWTLKNAQIEKQSWITMDIENLKDWNLVDSGDFDGDEVKDLVFVYNGKDTRYKGAIILNFLENPTNLQTKSDPSTAWLPWIENQDDEGNLTKDLIAVNDVNRDGFVDLILRTNQRGRIRSDRGKIEILLLKNTENFGIVDLPKFYDLNWNPLFINLNMDNNLDLLWLNLNSEDQNCQGKTSTFFMSGIFRLELKIEKEIPAC